MFNLSQFPLNFAPDSLDPYVSPSTIDFHYNKHMAGYINNLNGLIDGTEFMGKSLVDIIAVVAANPGVIAGHRESVDAPDITAQKIFNNAAQVYNHDFFFKCLSLNSAADIPAEIADRFGGREKFLTDFKAAAVGVFGSGWAWLVRNESGALEIKTTANANAPISCGCRPIMTIDVWEHAYYIDYQNRRPDFIDAILNHLINWEFVASNL